MTRYDQVSVCWPWVHSLGHSPNVRILSSPGKPQETQVLTYFTIQEFLMPSAPLSLKIQPSLTPLPR